MDVTPYLEIKPAPRVVFDALPERRTRVRFMLPTPDGDWRAVTWGAFATQIRRCALFLASAGLKPGDRAAIFAPNSVEWLSAALAIQSAGGVMVPIYPANTVPQAAYVANHCDAKVLFVDTPALLMRVFEAWGEYAQVVRIVTLAEKPIEAGPLLEKMRSEGRPCPQVAEVEKKLVPWSRAQALGAARDGEAPDDFERMLGAVSLDQVGIMLYTSGTSGNPKGVPLTHRMTGVNSHDWLKNNAPVLNGNDVDVLWLPMSHIFGFGEACLGNTLGFTTYFADPATALQRLKEVRPSVFMSVPALWEKLAGQAGDRPGALQELTGGRLTFCLSGGAGLKREVKERFHSAGLLIIEGYGLTECSPTLTLNAPGAFRFDSVGKPFPSVQLKLAEDGEILAKGPSVFHGYHKDPAATKEAFDEGGWFKTGDVGRFTDDGFLQIVDRKKDILVTAGGKNVPPANIELKFKDDPFIAHVVVYGDGQRYLVAGVWLNEPAVNAHLDASGVAPAARGEAKKVLVQRRIDEVNTQLASYETLKKFAIVETPLTVDGGLLTSTLKVRRKQVYATFKSTFEALYT
ncbi:MAG: long-chain fatty acid--CoA ligase [Myxococcaceae bacterium]|nr:long-chain fatty acid--CoA ligase [Myxococcaceae bacterium]